MKFKIWMEDSHQIVAEVIFKNKKNKMYQWLKTISEVWKFGYKETDYQKVYGIQVCPHRTLGGRTNCIACMGNK